jgi:hypothetical protein
MILALPAECDAPRAHRDGRLRPSGAPRCTFQLMTIPVVPIEAKGPQPGQSDRCERLGHSHLPYHVAGAMVPGRRRQPAGRCGVTGSP